MSHQFEINAEVRHVLGKGASRRLRRLNNKVPAILYGADKASEPLMLEHHSVLRLLENEASYSHILTLILEGRKERVLLKDLQRHPYKTKIMHMDFQRVSGNEVIHRKVPLHFTNEDKCAGVKQGGIINHQLKEIEIACAVDHLPEHITVDVAELQVDQIWHLSDLVMPKDVTIVALSHGEEHDLPVVAVHLPRAAVEESATAAPAAAEGENP